MRDVTDELDAALVVLAALDAKRRRAVKHVIGVIPAPRVHEHGGAGEKAAGKGLVQAGAERRDRVGEVVAVTVDVKHDGIDLTRLVDPAARADEAVVRQEVRGVVGEGEPIALPGAHDALRPHAPVRPREDVGRTVVVVRYEVEEGGRLIPCGMRHPRCTCTRHPQMRAANAYANELPVNCVHTRQPNTSMTKSTYGQ